MARCTYRSRAGLALKSKREAIAAELREAVDDRGGKRRRERALAAFKTPCRWMSAALFSGFLPGSKCTGIAGKRSFSCRCRNPIAAGPMLLVIDTNAVKCITMGTEKVLNIGLRVSVLHQSEILMRMNAQYQIRP